MKMTGVTRAWQRQTLCLKRDGPFVLTCVGAVGVVGTAILAAKATPKAIQLLQIAEKKKSSKLTKLEIVDVAGPVYIPSILIGASTVLCIFSANVLNKKRQASLISAYALVDSAFKEYQNKLIELHGKEADIEVRDSLIRDCCNFHLTDDPTPDQRALWYDELSGKTIRRYEKEIIDAEYRFNRNFCMRGYASLNEFYEFLGLPQTEEGESLGWSMSDGIYWVDFEHRLVKNTDGTSCYAIDMVYSPEPDYMQDWENEN